MRNWEMKKINENKYLFLDSYIPIHLLSKPSYCDILDNNWCDYKANS